VEQQANRLSRLIGRLFDVSRAEAGKIRLECQAVDIVALVRGVIAVARVVATDRSFIEPASKPLYGLADPLRFEQVVTNLIDNAVKYSPHGSQIDVEVSTPCHDRVEISVRDRGPGIPAEQRSHIFERFYQADVRSHSSGLGLGLYISRQIVEFHGGRIWVDFPADGGARFAFDLPSTVPPPNPKSQSRAADRRAMLSGRPVPA
jgi:signal transduction histidine kinase